MPLNHQNQYTQLTEAHFQAIGKIVVEWSNIEYLLGFILRRLSFNDFLGRSFIERMNASQVSGAINDALDIHLNRYSGAIVDKQVLLDIKETKGEIENLRKIRNKISHLCWMRSDDETIFGAKLSEEAHHDDKNSFKISLQELDEYYQSIHTIVERLQIIAYYHLPTFNDEKVQKMLRFENSSLKAWGLEDIVKMRFHHRIAKLFIKGG